MYLVISIALHIILLLFLTNKKNNLDKFNQTIIQNKEYKYSILTLEKEKKYYQDQQDKIKDMSKIINDKNDEIDKYNKMLLEEKKANEMKNDKLEEQKITINLLSSNKNFNITEYATKNLEKLERYALLNLNFNYNVVLEIYFDGNGEVERINNFSNFESSDDEDEKQKLEIIKKYKDEELSNCKVLLKIFNEEIEIEDKSQNNTEDEKHNDKE